MATENDLQILMIDAQTNGVILRDWLLYKIYQNGGGTVITGTANYIAKFNATGDNVEDTTWINTTTTLEPVTDAAQDIGTSSKRILNYYGKNVNLKGVGSIGGNTTLLITNSNDEASLRVKDNGATWNAGKSDISTNTCFGIECGINITTGDRNTLYGSNAGKVITTGNTNCIFGSTCGRDLTEGEGNVAIGANAFYFATTGSYNVAIGRVALQFNNDNFNTAVGFGAQSFSTANGGTSLGAYSAYNNSTGDRVLAIGAQSLYTNTTGSYSTAVGYGALYTNNGNRNIAIGYNAGYYETGDDKLFIDNRSRGDEATARTNALIYGIMGATPDLQYFNINGVVKVGTFTTTQRNALTAENGMILYNSTTSKIQAYAGGAWVDLH